MSVFKNKNSLILIISAVLIIAAIIIAVSALADSPKKVKDTVPETVSTDLTSASDINTTTTEKTATATGKIGKYKISAGGDDLSLRMKPDANSDRIYYITDGTEVEILAVWEDWGYAVYEQSGGWLSMNYLEYVGQ